MVMVSDGQRGIENAVRIRSQSNWIDIGIIGQQNNFCSGRIITHLHFIPRIHLELGSFSLFSNIIAHTKTKSNRRVITFYPKAEYTFCYYIMPYFEPIFAHTMHKLSLNLSIEGKVLS